MFDEPTGVPGGTGSSAKPHFQPRERARNGKPSLGDDDCDGADVRQPKRESVDPVPVREVADDDERKACNDEDRDAHVQEKHGVGKEGGCCGTHPLSRLTFDMRRGAKGAKGAKRSLAHPLN